MIETVLERKNLSFRTKLTVKSLISLGIVALAVVLPQIFHLAFGASSGVKFLPMYAPVILGGCLLGWKWGLALGLLSPLCSFAITSAFGSPMPAAARLPFMMAELAVFAVVSGLFSKKIMKNAWFAVPAVLLAGLAGRASFIALVAIFQNVAPFTVSLIWSQIKTGFLGLGLQIVILPLIVGGLKYLLNKDASEKADD